MPKFSNLLIAVLGLVGFSPTPLAWGQKPEPDCLDCRKQELGKPPKYRVAWKWKSRTGDRDRLVHISINKEYFSRPGLLALACRLDKDFTSESRVLVWIFDDYESARRYVAPWEPEKPEGWQEHEVSLRGYYMRDVTAGKHWIAWYSDPLHKTGEETANLYLPEPVRQGSDLK